jgi:hypothetical protein
MNSDLTRQAEQSLQAALTAFPDQATGLLEALNQGAIDGREHNAVLRFLSEDQDEEIIYVASGQNNNLQDLPPVESFVLGVRPGIDTAETCAELTALRKVVVQFIDSKQDELGDLVHEGWADSH